MSAFPPKATEIADIGMWQWGCEACQTAILTHGGMSYSSEYHVERYLRESFIPRIAPISPHMILNFVAEKALGLPRSY